jgi:hypothetical protein
MLQDIGLMALYYSKDLYIAASIATPMIEEE